MDAIRFIGFALIVALVVAGLDYYQQDKKAEGSLSLNGYVETINDRFALYEKERDAQQAERERQKLWKAGAKQYLPEPPPGWKRHALTDTDNEAVSAVLAKFQPAPLISSIADPMELANLNRSGKEGVIRKLDETGMVYSKDQEIVWLDISLKPKSVRNTMAGLALGAQEAFMNGTMIQKGYAIVDGVAFLETTGNLLDGNDKPEYRAFTGRIGFDQEVVIRLNANASDATIREFLGLVDYEGLNALLPLPALIVGQGIDVPLEQQPKIADEMHDLYETMKVAQQKVTQEKLKNLDVASVMVNTLTSSGFNTEGVVDITNGEVFENQELSQLTYIRTQDLLLKSAMSETGPEDDGAGDTGGFFRNLMNKAFKAKADADVAGPKSATSTATAVTVRKGGVGGASCAALGSSKRCLVGNN
ncbi:hypothetical protein [Ruegeria lacuscaerulensis]|uniref:hypothetical protein n=1 Tax=Ruegeria lacuscaerulensis TaxID=55218 RepID=UPI00147C5D5D|nr:hypothetical protein [Ruegeria lacuscaerulensis]